MVIEKSVVINRSKTDVFNYLKITKNQNNFSVWNMKDPKQKTSEKGMDGTIGYVYSWDSQDKNVGAGSQEIKNIVENEKIEYELRFERPMKNVARSKFVISKISETQTSVSWDFRGPTKFPMSLFSGIFKKMLGKDIAKSLDNLRINLESR